MNGVVNVYKEPGMTSFQVVARVRKLFNVKKCGHTGTLDPMAEGVLPICLGYATRFADYITATDKQYIASFKMGATYDSFDTTGNLMASSDMVPSIEDIRKYFSDITGVTELTVPAFSAKKINGERAYKLARKGEIEDAGTAAMRIDKIELISYEYPDGVFVVDCGKGTYVRSIINSLGEKTGAYAAMSGLIRSRSGAFKADDALKLDDLARLAGEGRLESAVRRIEDVVPLKRAVIKDSAVKGLMNGMSPNIRDYTVLPDLSDAEECFIFDSNKRLLALGVAGAGDKVIKTDKVFVGS